MDQYHIRRPDSEESRGPFTVAKLKSMAEMDQIDPQTLYYDRDEEAWVRIADDEELRDSLFPQKKALNLRKAPAPPPTLEGAGQAQTDAGPSIDEMIAAAEGQTDETRHLRKKAREQEKAASYSPLVLGLLLLISAVALLGSNYPTIMTLYEEQDYFAFLHKPMILVGALDALFALACFLAATGIYPVLRVRAMLGLGFFGYIFWSWQQYPMLLGVCLGSLAIYICTMTLNLKVMVPSALLGIGGMVLYAMLQLGA